MGNNNSKKEILIENLQLKELNNILKEETNNKIGDFKDELIKKDEQLEELEKKQKKPIKKQKKQKKKY